MITRVNAAYARGTSGAELRMTPQECDSEGHDDEHGYGRAAQRLTRPSRILTAPEVANRVQAALLARDAGLTT
jgi:hypothetical protein